MAITVLKLSIISDEISQDLEHALKVIKELGAEYVELRTLWNRYVVELTDSEFSEAVSLVKRYGLNVSHICSPTFKIYIWDEKGYKEHLKILRRAIELSKRLDIEYTRIFTFWWQGELGKYLEKIMEKMIPALEIAESEGVDLIVENEYSCTVGTGREARALIDRIRSKRLKVLWDPGNAFFARETPYPDGYNAVKDLIAYVHIKDAAVEDGRFVFKPVGRGFIDYENMLRNLSSKDLIVSLETHYAPQGDKERGTRESFKGVKRILEKIYGEGL